MTWLQEDQQMRASYVRHGLGAVRPYLYGQPDLVDFITQVFGATIVEQVGGLTDAHIEAQIGDSMIVLEIGGEVTSPTYSSLYVYVEDVDATYKRALQAGATSLAEPTDKPYQDRNAGVKDTFGNTWWIGTYLGER
jgi:PhnB protein